MRFLDPKLDYGLEIVTSHDPLLVVCSFIAAVVAAYAALGTLKHVKAGNSIVANLAWLACGAIALGSGIWSMHFIAMLAYRLPIDVHYDLWLTAGSGIPAVIAAAVALYFVSWPTLRSRNIMLGGLLIGAGVGAMHYTGMAAMQLAADMFYSLPLVVLSVLVAVCLAVISLLVLQAFIRRENDHTSFWARPAAALLMGVAVSGMHYTAMAAVRFYSLPDAPQHESVAVLGLHIQFATPQLAAFVILIFSLVIAVLLVTMHEIEYATQRLLLKGIQQKNISLESMVHDRTRALQEANEQLERRVKERTIALEASKRELEANNQQGRLRAEISELMQTVLNLDEAMNIMPRRLSRMFPRHHGALYLNKPSRSYLELRAHWGNKPMAEMIEMSECRGLQIGHSYQVEKAGVNLVCAHTGVLAADEMTLCIPLLARGETIGLLHLRGPLELDPHERDLFLGNAQRVADQMAVGLANLNMREALREQAIRDPLTGLHNRRFLEETMSRELSRAARERQSFAVFMLDVDHFKRYNDKHGHVAGDEVLRALGGVLKESVRTGDLACRFGGEEFTVVLSPSDLAQSSEWASRLLDNVSKLQVKSGNQILPAITVSLGLALYPEHGTDSGTLLQTADLALYAAKHTGRNRLVVAGQMDKNRNAAEKT